MAGGEAKDIALAIVRREGAWLVDRRPKTGPFGGLWEFPGGKMRPGETAAQAAVRECAEEVSITVHPIGMLEVVEHDYGAFRVRLHPVLCRYEAGRAAARAEAVDQVCWVDDATLATLQMPAANRSIVAALVSQGGTG